MKNRHKYVEHLRSKVEPLSVNFMTLWCVHYPGANGYKTHRRRCKIKQKPLREIARAIRCGKARPIRVIMLS